MEQSLILIGFAVVIIGILLMIAGIFISAKPDEVKTDVKGGGVIMIGPIPIVFGTDKNLLIPILILVIVIMIIAYMMMKS